MTTYRIYTYSTEYGKVIEPIEGAPIVYAEYEKIDNARLAARSTGKTIAICSRIDEERHIDRFGGKKRSWTKANMILNEIISA